MPLYETTAAARPHDRHNTATLTTHTIHAASVTSHDGRMVNNNIATPTSLHHIVCQVSPASLTASLCMGRIQQLQHINIQS